MAHDLTVETINIAPNVRVRIEQDTDAQMPEDDVFKITCLATSRHTLGDKPVSREEAIEIGTRIRSGEYIGWPVYAYVHSGSTIRMSESGNPFHCPWDSAQSGVVYAKREDVLREIVGGKRLTKKALEKAKSYAKGVVEAFDQWLTGDVYGVIVEATRVNGDGDVQVNKTLDSCWGFFGRDYAIEEAKSMGESYKEAV